MLVLALTVSKLMMLLDLAGATPARLSDAEQKAIVAMADASKCRYVWSIRGLTSSIPNIVRIPNVCPEKLKGKKHLNLCVGVIFCETGFQDFYFMPKCMSRDGYHCPSARDCLRATAFDSFRWGEATASTPFPDPRFKVFDESDPKAAR